MRGQIRLERQIELVLEGHRYWDVRRWKVAHKDEYYREGQLHGMDIEAGDQLLDPSFRQRIVAFTRAQWQTILFLSSTSKRDR
jgi:hypothetical protein